MIVSGRIDTSSLAVRPKRRNFKAVSLSVPGSDVVSSTPPQAPTFNAIKRIRKPFLYGNPPKLDGGRVPIAQLQEGYEEKTFFDAPIYFVPAPLKVVEDRSTGFDFSSMSYDVLVGTEVAPAYNMGIRPGPRPIQPTQIIEPAGEIYREGTPAKPKNKFTTYDVGSLDRAILGY
jgi:hypothetical protein